MADERTKQDEPTQAQAELEETRREALAKMGRFAGYTAPAMMVLLGATKARAQVNGSPAPPKNQ